MRDDRQAKEVGTELPTNEQKDPRAARKLAALE
jgi:hypothetical protein